MFDAFISYVEEDGPAAAAIAAGLDAAGYRSWFYERDSIPGLSYLKQTRQAIDAARSFILVVSRATIPSHQVDKEVVHAHEVGLPIIPVLAGMTFAEFQRARPEWHQAVGAAVGIRVPPDGPGAIVPRIAAGLAALGVLPAPPGRAGGGPSAPAGEPLEQDIDLSGAAAGAGEEVPDGPTDFLTVSLWEESDEGAADPDGAAAPALTPQFVHEHPATGFLADLVLPDAAGAGGRLTLAFEHPLLGPSPFRVEVAAPAGSSDPVRYLRLPDLIHGYPVVLRVYSRDRLRHRAATRTLSGTGSLPAVRTAGTRESVTAEDPAGLLVDGKFVALVPAGAPLPRAVAKRFRTRRDRQKAIALAPAVRAADGRVHEFPPLRVPVMPAPAGVAWVEVTFRVDPDGRYTVFVRNPLTGMAVTDVVFQ